MSESPGLRNGRMGNSVWDRPAVKVRKAAACQDLPRPQQKFTVLELCCILAWIGCNAESPSGEQLTGEEKKPQQKKT
ncbi:hypothetical protein N7447_003572 [Penicillium robsamsonii]|uniref:uncharacterized protein n=1 Tax=Penicillium robsamsonii TaxID=1792511 RepID=UPI002548A5F2|nr:uncharacterized protein N7447_003572 [Penicillium robsamsonii]KAJ5826809.1 hypothetical protein N7447_003572 [Penicillium robsamsonii]